MTNNPTPATVFGNAAPKDDALTEPRPEDQDAAATTTEDNAVEDNDDEESKIVYKETYMDGHVQRTREHGPMPVSEWHKYAEKNGL